MFQHNSNLNANYCGNTVNGSDLSVSDFSNDASRCGDAGSQLVEFADESGRFIKEEEYSACVALLDMADPSKQTDTINGSPRTPIERNDSQPVFSMTQSNQLLDSSHDFFCFFPNYTRQDANECMPGVLRAKQELANNEESYQNSLHEHDYHLSVKSEQYSREMLPVDAVAISKDDLNNDEFKSCEKRDSQPDDCDASGSSCMPGLLTDNVDTNFVPGREEMTESMFHDPYKPNLLSYCGSYVDSTTSQQMAYNENLDYNYYSHYNYEPYQNANFASCYDVYENKAETSSICQMDGDNGSMMQLPMHHNEAYNMMNMYQNIPIHYGMNNSNTSSQEQWSMEVVVNEDGTVSHTHCDNVDIAVEAGGGEILGSNCDNSKTIIITAAEHEQQMIQVENYAIQEEKYYEEEVENIPCMMTNDEMQKINSKYTHQRFPIKLWNLASDVEFNPIRWSADGLSLILDEVMLEPCLGYFFRSKKFSSFLRQLHLYGFRKVTRARSHRTNSTGVRLSEEKSRTDFISEYQCQHFQRARYDLVKHVRRFYGPASCPQMHKSDSMSPDPPESPMVMVSGSIETECSPPPASSLVYSLHEPTFY